MFTFVPICIYLAGVTYTVLFFSAFLSRRSTVSRSFAAIMLCAAVWSFSYAEELRATEIETMLGCLQVRMACIPFIPFFWLILTLALTGRIARFRPSQLALFGIVPLVTALLAITMREHTWLRFDFYTEPINGMQLLRFSKSPFDILHEVHNHAVSLMGFVVLVISYKESNQALRKQLLLLAISFLFPLIINLLFIFDLLNTRGLNPTPFALFPASLLQAWIVFRHHILDVVPIARSMIFQHVEVGALIFDKNGLLVDLNSAARNFINLPDQHLLSRPVHQLPPPWSSAEQLMV